ncbi:small nuclear ribonucleoprotein G isoform X1 [Saimiri boliviensis]|uniref:small nuclear ribonucleoprotein G isoform X1 n=1 Tax=Saimiri boliviensis TaxID=27679 RepID=UPI003D78A4C0
MSKAHPPELKKFMDKKLSLKLNGGRHVQGILRGFDPFMNLVIDECVEMATSGQQNNIGMVMCMCWLGTVAHTCNPSAWRG